MSLAEAVFMLAAPQCGLTLLPVGMGIPFLFSELGMTLAFDKIRDSDKVDDRMGDCDDSLCGILAKLWLELSD